MKVDTKTKARRAARKNAGKTGADLVAIGPGSHMDWLLGFHPHPDERPCLLLVGPEKETFLMPGLNAEGSREETDIEFHTWADADGPHAALAAALAAIDATKRRMSCSMRRCAPTSRCCCSMRCPAPTMRSPTQTLGALRMRKDTAEYASAEDECRHRRPRHAEGFRRRSGRA